MTRIMKVIFNILFAFLNRRSMLKLLQLSTQGLKPAG